MVSDLSACIDLHLHSTASDGTLSPAEILQTARDLGLRAISITDHDTLAGVKEVLCLIPSVNITFLTGVEISTSPPDTCPLSGSMHLLGYGIRVEDRALNRELTRLQNARTDRNPKIIEKLNALGFGISLEKLLNTYEGQLSRPHIARYLVDNDHAKSIDDAFDRYLGKGKPAYVDKYRIDYRRAIRAVQDAGGIAVLAHPSLLNLNPKPLEALIATLVSAGLKGIEVYYPEHTPCQVEFYLSLARQFDLLVTGGTDFHGALTPNLQMGTGKGSLAVPYTLYEQLLQHL